MVVDLPKEIRRAVDTGKVAFGTKACRKNLAHNHGEMIIVSANVPHNEKETLKHLTSVENKKFLEFPENGLALGSVCGKPFVVSAMIVLDFGKSKLQEASEHK